MKKYTALLRQALDTKQAAALIGCAPYTLKLSRSTGMLLGSPGPVYRKMGRIVRYDLETIEAWIAQFTIQQNTAT